MRADDGDITEKGETTPGAGTAWARCGHKVHSAHVVLPNRDIGVPEEPLGANPIPSLDEDLAESGHSRSMTAMDAARAGAG